MSSGSNNQSEPLTTDKQARDSETELAQVRAERDRALARLDTRERRRRIGGVARRTTVSVLVVLAALLIPITATVTWAHRTVVNTDTYVNTVGPIASDPAVTSTLARIATDQLFSALNPQSAIADALPPRAVFLAGPITNGVKGFIHDQAEKVLAGDRFHQVWVTANRTAHTALMKVLRGESKAVVTTNGQVVLSVVPLLNDVLESMQSTISDLVGRDVTLPTLTGTELPSGACAKISAALSRPLPDTCGQIPLFPADKLDQAQWAIRAFDRATLALLIITPLLVVAALLLSRRRRRTLLQLAVATVLVMVIVRRVVMRLQDAVIDTGRPENEAARSAIIHQLLRGFFTVSIWVLVIGLAVVAVALITGPYAWAVTARRWIRANSEAAVHMARDAVSGRAAAGVWVRAHLDMMRIVGGLVAVLLILVLNVNLAWLLVVLAVVGLYEFWLYRLGAIGASTPAATGGPGPSD
ncbi:MAG TPA: hypothetical protein VE441_14050 [Mycobacterium sp.]|jgi:hypothetical protein|nr:hypothetical protein [Mycobacterium sp.]